MVLALGLAAMIIIAACDSGRPSAAPPTGPVASRAQVISTPSTAVPPPTVLPTPTPTPMPIPTPTLLPTVGASPNGPWSGIRWISAGPVFPPLPTSPDGTADATTVDVFGWSRGYVGFAEVADESSPASPTLTIVATSSTDGLHWSANQPIDLTGLDSPVFVTDVVEGPTGLLAVGYEGGGTCGGPVSAVALWTSTDGRAWHRVHLPRDFAEGRVYTVDAGSTGFIASGTLKDGVTQALWLSRDGTSWHSVHLPRSTFGKVVVDGATDFSAGFVVSGVILGQDGCGGPAHITPSLWWSRNGTIWTRSALSGTAPAHDATMTVTRISDRTLMAVASVWDGSTQRTSQTVWVTTNGRTWARVRSPSKLLDSTILSNGQRGLVVLDPLDNVGPPTIATVAGDLAVTPLQQKGDGPVATDATPVWVSAFGPTGVVVLSTDDSNLWLGVPTTR
jgi:hypothetical protein